jgi:hypothetical protein
LLDTRNRSKINEKAEGLNANRPYLLPQDTGGQGYRPAAPPPGDGDALVLPRRRVGVTDVQLGLANLLVAAVFPPAGPHASEHRSGGGSGSSGGGALKLFRRREAVE